MPKSYDSYGLYISKVLRQVAAEGTQISSSAVAVMDDILSGVLDTMHTNMHSIMDASNVKTVLEKVVETATRLTLPGELGKHAVSAGRNAVGKFKAAKTGTEEHPVSRSTRAGLQFSVGRVESALNDLHFSRISPLGSVYTTAVIEYICAEILELASNKTRDSKSVRMTPQHINLAIQNDEELSAVMKSTVVAKGGVTPNIAAVLLPKKASPKASPKPKKAKKASPKAKKASPKAKKASPKKAKKASPVAKAAAAAKKATASAKKALSVAKKALSAAKQC